MAKGDHTELFMKFDKQKGTQIKGEAGVQIVTPGKAPNPLIKGFAPGYILEIERFSFRAGTVDEDGKVGKEKSRKEKKDKKDTKAITKRGDYQAWRNGQRDKFPIDLQPVSFTRAIDAASPKLINACLTGEMFDSATLVKRHAAGTTAGGEVFLRLDFKEVLIIEVEWEDDDEIREDVRFICRSVTMSYRPQQSDGSLGPTVTGFWSMVPGDQPMNLR
jgi:type VI secretion system secreted protein Hcp